MDWYRNEPQTVALTDGGVAVQSIVVTGTDGVAITDIAPSASIEIPQSAVCYDGVLRLEATLNGNKSIKFYNVVTPLFTPAELIENDPDFAELEDRIPQLEKLVRHVVEAYTGQSFGLRKGTEIATWASNTWVTESPIVSIESFGAPAEVVVTYPTIGGDVLRRSYDPKSDTYILSGKTYDPWNPQTKAKTAPVVGIFGYEYVPFDVKEAAMHLAASYGCNESMWRDRYLQSMASADWRVTYTSGAYVGTGSVIADQLLEKYQNSGMVAL